MPHPLDEWLPNDAPWSTLPLAVLRKQCAIRNLSTTGFKKDLVQRLLTYGQADPNTSAIKRRRPWQTEPVSRPSYQAAALDAENASFPLVRVVDNPDRKGDGLKRDFQLWDWKNTMTIITVSIDTVLKCECPMDGPCVHTIYVLRFVLNCPEPYRWQRALLPSELRTIYQHSHVTRAFGPNNSETQNDFCMLCFRGISKDPGRLFHCKKCRRGIHPLCKMDVGRVREPACARRGACWICYENVEWNIEKFCWNDRVLPAAPSIAPAVPAQAGPVADAIPENIQRKEPEDKQPNNTPSIKRRLPSSLFSTSSSSNSLSSLASTVNQQVPSSAHRRGQLPRESGTKALQAPRESGPLSASTHTNESIPLPGIPSLIWQEMREQREQREQSEKQQREKARQQAAPFAIPANNNGIPLIRRDSTKPDSHAKRPVKPAHPKDLVYDTKRKKKLIPELQFCEEVLTELRKQRYYEFNEVFQKPVDPVALNIPTYHEIIKKPMDLSTMQSKLNAGDYANAKEFERDFELIIKNCRLFNGEVHIIYGYALRLQSLYRREMSKKDKWLAKHTRTPAPHHSSNLPKPSAALGHALPTLNPGGGEQLEVTVSPDAASIIAGDHTSPRASSSAAETPASTATTATPQHNQAGATSISGHDASVADAVSQAPQSGVTTTSLTEPAGATGARDTTSTPAGDNPASASASVPPDRSASAPTHAHSGTQTTIDHTKALELVQECSYLAKKSVQMRKKSEREAKRMEKKHRRELKKITKMEKKHRRELKKTKRKSKQGVKRLEKKIESLEKEVLKALARPEVAEGAAA